MIFAARAPDFLAREDGVVHEGRSFVWRINALADDCLFQAGRRQVCITRETGFLLKNALR